MYNQEKKIVNRCWWVNMKNPLYVEYHDCEWSIPEHSDKKLLKCLYWSVSKLDYHGNVY